MDRVKLHQLLYKNRSFSKAAAASVLPDYSVVDQKSRRKGMMRLLLWEEFKIAHPDALQYTAFCASDLKWQSQSSRVFRQTYTLGDKLFVDYAGQTVPIADRYTGAIEQAQLSL